MMPNDFSASGTVGHRFVLLDDFQHCGLSVRVAHEICSRARLLPASSNNRPVSQRVFVACGTTVVTTKDNAGGPRCVTGKPVSGAHWLEPVHATPWRILFGHPCKRCKDLQA